MMTTVEEDSESEEMDALELEACVEVSITPMESPNTLLHPRRPYFIDEESVSVNSKDQEDRRSLLTNHVGGEEIEEAKKMTGHRFRMHCIIGCPFAIAITDAFMLMVMYRNTDPEYTADTYYTAFKPSWFISVTVLIVIWKAIELFDAYVNKAIHGIGIVLRSLMATIGALCSLIDLFVTAGDPELWCVGGNYCQYRDTGILFHFGWWTLIITSMIEVFIAYCTRRKGATASEKFGPVLQVGSFVSQWFAIRGYGYLYYFYILSFFPWVCEGLRICNRLNREALLYWNAMFKLITAASFLVAATGEIQSVSNLLLAPLYLLWICVAFDSQAINTPRSSNSYDLSRYRKCCGKCMQGFKVLYIYFFLPFLCYLLATSEENWHIVIIYILAIALLTLKNYIPICQGTESKEGAATNDDVGGDQLVSRDTENDTENEENTQRDPQDSSVLTRGANVSIFQKASTIFYLATLALITIAMSLFRDMVGDTPDWVDDTVLDTDQDTWLFNLMIVCGSTFLIHGLCWIKYTFLMDVAEVGAKYPLPQDTYIFMMRNQIPSQAWLVSISISVLQAVLIAMILFAQIQEATASKVFLNVPYDVTAYTRVGQVAGMVILLLYQKDFWIASTLLEIRLIGGPQRDDMWILIPNIIRFLQAVGVILASTFLILQSDNIIDLVKDYTAIFFISEIDDFVFTLASHGYLGPVLKKDASDAENKYLDDVELHPVRSIGFMTIFSTMITVWVHVTSKQINGEFFRTDNPECYEKLRPQNPTILDYKNGYCDEYLNFPECTFDGGDCMIQNVINEANISASFPNCSVPWKFYIGNQRCDGVIYNTQACGWDDGDCQSFDEMWGGHCNVDRPDRVGDGQCDGGLYNTAACGWDGGDCQSFNEKYGWNCTVDDPFRVGDC